MRAPMLGTVFACLGLVAACDASSSAGDGSGGRAGSGGAGGHVSLGPAVGSGGQTAGATGGANGSGGDPGACNFLDLTDCHCVWSGEMSYCKGTVDTKSCAHCADITLDNGLCFLKCFPGAVTPCGCH